MKNYFLVSFLSLKLAALFLKFIEGHFLTNCINILQMPFLFGLNGLVDMYDIKCIPNLYVLNYPVYAI